MNPCHWAFLNCNKSQYAESERERERGRERKKEKHLFVVPFLHAFIG